MECVLYRMGGDVQLFPGIKFSKVLCIVTFYLVNIIGH